ncbi:MAG: electron transfer flavoprotein subunit alpha/FixB family protein, partial [Dehalococcoidia bacterium]|nr:electron transfer flavoprotein subunit alpha/FixB family protein [Dehalococcoidia bacterium]
MADNQGVMVVAEVADGALSGISAELLGVGRCLADGLGEPLMAVVMGKGIAGFGNALLALGADCVLAVDDALLEKYQADAYVAALEKVVKEHTPNVLLLGHTATGRELAPRLAFRLKTGLTTDCIDLNLHPDSKLMLATKPVYGGNAQAVYICEASSPQMATIRSKAICPAVADASRKGEVITVSAGIDASVVRARVVDKVKAEVEGVRLEDAPIVVSAGRGVGSVENMHMVEALAKILGAAIGGSRGAVDSNIIPSTLQIGLTGKIVSPDLYVAIGISGALQHMAGCSGSKTVVAVNRDADAPIFKMAHYGVVGDFKKVLPVLAAACKELLAS